MEVCLKPHLPLMGEDWCPLQPESNWRDLVQGAESVACSLFCGQKRHGPIQLALPPQQPSDLNTHLSPGVSRDCGVWGWSEQNE